MKLHHLRPAEGAVRERKRVGRGRAAGQGKTAGRGTKGTKARGEVHIFFEGGQMPITRRIPKRGFTNPFREENQVVRLDALQRLPEGTEVTVASLVEAGLVRKANKPVKLLANGRIEQAVVVRGLKVSAGARDKIVAAGGRVEE